MKHRSKQRWCLKRLATLCPVIVVFLLSTGCADIMGTTDQEGADDPTPRPDQSDSLSGVAFDLIDAEVLVSRSIGSFSTSLIGASAVGSESPLLKITEDGGLEEVMTVPEGVTIPPIEFLSVSPVEDAIFVCFDGTMTVEDQSIHFMKVYEDGTLQIVEENPGVVRFDGAWEGQQDPVAYDAEGGLFYVLEQGGTQALMKFGDGQRRRLSSNFDTEVQRFFSDGTNLFYQGRNLAQSNQAVYMKIVRPDPTIEDVFYRADGEAWVKDAFMHDGELILSGWQIPDLTLEDREYTGILQLDVHETEIAWSQVFGSAATGGETAARLSLDDYVFATGGTVHQTAIDAVISQFFSDGVPPSDIDYDALFDADVDLDASGFSYRDELTFWRELLDGQEGLNEGQFEILNNVTTAYLPPFLGYTTDTGAAAPIEVFIFDAIFSGEETSTIPVSDEIVDATGLNEFLQSLSDVDDYFSSIALKSGVVFPDALPYVTPAGVDPVMGIPLPTDYAAFAAFIDAYFDYQLADGVDLSSTYDFDPGTSHQITNDILGIWNLFVGLSGPYPGRNTDGSRLNRTYPYRGPFLDDTGAPDSDAIVAFLSVYFPDVDEATIPAGASITTNSNSEKESFLRNSFSLGEPRYDYESLIGATTFDAYTKDPFQGDTIYTLFDSFNTLELFTIASDGSYFGVFEQGASDNTYKVVRMRDEEGTVEDTVVMTDIEATAFVYQGESLVWIEPTGTSVSRVAMADVSTDNPARMELLSDEAGLEVFNLAFDQTLNAVSFTAWSQAEEVSYIGRIDGLTGSLNLMPADGIDAASDVEVY